MPRSTRQDESPHRSGRDLEAGVLEHVDSMRNEIIGFLQKLVAFPSVTGDEGAIQEFIADRLRAMGLDVDVWEPDHEELKRHPGYVPVEKGYSGRPNVVGALRGTGGGRSLLFNGHVDVIPVQPEAWSVNPWGGEILQGRLYGRGASDMKSGVAAMTMAVKAVMDLGIKLRGDVLLEYTVDEEITGHGTLACILRGYRADAGISCETSGLCVQPASIGRIWFEILVKGKPAGIQHRWEGVNAIEKGYGIVEAVSRLEQIRVAELHHPLYPNNMSALPCMVGAFHAGQYASAFPDTCLLKGSIATLPGESSQEVKRGFVEHIMSYCKTDPWLKDHPPEIKFVGYFAEPSEIPADHPIVRLVADKFSHVTGSEAVLTGREGAADTRFLSTFGQTPTVIFGPGPTLQMHATDEWVPVDDVVTAVKVLALTTLEWCTPSG
ncbi:MAG: ArgE/DapE family deacylase [Candidatus Rokubacteria bacterium]|nr:ArgE/DapE family deacylase [Candidatus Rokubacteria bacterium]